MCDLRRHVDACSRRLPCPESKPDVWYDFIKSSPTEFAQIVMQMCFAASVGDKSVDATFLCPVTFYFCDICEYRPSFKSNKALLSHQRVIHGSRNCMRLYALANGICSACQTKFQTRLRLLAHLCKSRRPKCRELILQSCSQLPETRSKELDDQDRLLRRALGKSGHTHVIATAPTRTARGKRIGHVTQ